MLSDIPLFFLLCAMAFAYGCGSIPTGELIGRQLGIAVRKAGSGNIGATNVARTAGKTAGILTLVGDIAKGLLPVLIVRWLGMADIVQAGTAFAAVLGHTFSLFLGFSGGKGVATGLGVFLGLAPQAILLALLPFLLCFAVTRIVSLSSLAATLTTPLCLALLSYPRVYSVAGSLIALLIVVRHRENIVRLWKGEEMPFNAGKPPSPSA